MVAGRTAVALQGEPSAGGRGDAGGISAVRSFLGLVLPSAISEAGSLLRVRRISGVILLSLTFLCVADTTRYF